MAKKDKQKAKSYGNEASNGRLRIFVAGFAVEGGDSVLADGFKAIRDLTEAMKGSGVLLPPAPRQTPALAASSTGAASAAAVADEDEETEQGVVVETGDIEPDDAGAVRGRWASRIRSRRARVRFRSAGQCSKIVQRTNLPSAGLH